MSWDGIFADHALRCAEIDFSMEMADVKRNANARIRSLENHCWHNFAVCASAAKILRDMDPGHPFFSTEWRKTLGQAAISFIRDSESFEWSEVVSLAESFPLPPRDPASPPPPTSAEITRLNEEITMLRTRLGRAHSDIVDHMSQRAAFKAELTRLDASNPLVTNVELRQRICAAGQKAFLATRGDWRMVEEVAARFREGMAIVDPASGQGTET